ncbi:hypothetical protein ACFVT2_33625 [Streptomyces sp. NPDC058000]|uniref:hypothetical protein n=1 Tax=Streptomyces sp. NPDC058000 TaxID=3346299 RepID=UPI0036E04B76
MKAHNLAAVMAGFRVAGARCLIVSGVVDPAHGVHIDEIPQAAVTVCRLRADRDVLRRRRFVSRGGPAELLDAVLSAADSPDASDFATVCPDTSDLRVHEMARLVSERPRGWLTARTTATCTTRRWASRRTRASSSPRSRAGGGPRRTGSGGPWPLFWTHVNPYGRIELDMNRRLDLDLRLSTTPAVHGQLLAPVPEPAPGPWTTLTLSVR